MPAATAYDTPAPLLMSLLTSFSQQRIKSRCWEEGSFALNFSIVRIKKAFSGDKEQGNHLLIHRGVWRLSVLRFFLFFVFFLFFFFGYFLILLGFYLLSRSFNFHLLYFLPFLFACFSFGSPIASFSNFSSHFLSHFLLSHSSSFPSFITSPNSSFHTLSYILPQNFPFPSRFPPSFPPFNPFTFSSLTLFYSLFLFLISLFSPLISLFANFVMDRIPVRIPLIKRECWWNAD